MSLLSILGIRGRNPTYTGWCRQCGGRQPFAPGVCAVKMANLRYRLRGYCGGCGREISRFLPFDVGRQMAEQQDRLAATSGRDPEAP